MSEALSNTLVPPRFLFRFAVPVLRGESIWKTGGVELDESYRLLNLAELDDDTVDRERGFADVRMAWNADGLVFNVRVDSKKQPVWCRDGRLEDSDGLQVWIDTRATLNITAPVGIAIATRFYLRGGGQRHDEPLADQLLINRARENARPIRPRELQVASRITKTGYWLAAFIPAVALAGYDPQQYRQLGFTYAVYDRELGLQTFATGPAFPYDEDPTCWATLELAEP